MILSMIGFSTGGSAPVWHAVLLRKFAFNLGFQKNHGTLQKQMRVSENGQEAKGDMAWEEEWTCDCEPDPSAEHRREKEKRALHIEQRKGHKERLCRELSGSGNCKLSIWVDSRKKKSGEIILIRRYKNSNIQCRLKKCSKHIVRCIPPDVLPPKGNQYRRAFDYWWRWE